MKRSAKAAMLAVALATAPAVHAQGADVAFGGLSQDTTLPVEVASDSLDVSQADGTATFKGSVLVTQGEMRLSAGRVRVVYAEGDDNRIEELRASGGVTLVNGAEAAEAAEAVYSIEEGTVTMTGDVILTQGQNALSGERLTIDLTTGTGRMEGRVRTIFNSGNGN